MLEHVVLCRPLLKYTNSKLSFILELNVYFVKNAFGKKKKKGMRQMKYKAAPLLKHNTTDMYVEGIKVAAPILSLYFCYPS
jgi:hypothetical protein